jgi:hypothetical protein
MQDPTIDRHLLGRALYSKCLEDRRAYEFETDASGWGIFGHSMVRIIWANTGIGLAISDGGERLSQINTHPGSSSVAPRDVPAQPRLSLAKLIIGVYIISLALAMMTANALTDEKAHDDAGSTVEAGSTRTNP